MIAAPAEASLEIAALDNPQKRDMALAQADKLTKTELVRKTAAALTGTGWLPSRLRTPRPRSFRPRCFA